MKYERNVIMVNSKHNTEIELLKINKKSIQPYKIEERKKKYLMYVFITDVDIFIPLFQGEVPQSLNSKKVWHSITDCHLCMGLTPKSDNSHLIMIVTVHWNVKP